MCRLLFIAFIFALSPLAYSQGAFLGVQLEAPQAANASPRIAGVEEPSAASLMGLQQGDVILSIDQMPTETVDAMLRILGQRLPGEIVEIKVFRGLEEVTLTGILGRRPGDRKVYEQPPILPPSDSQMDQPFFPRLEEWPGFHDNAPWPDFPKLHGLGEWFDRSQLDGWPELRGLENWPDLRGFDAWPQFRNFGGRFTAPDFQFDFGDLGGVGNGMREVHIRYPETTPEEEREALIAKAKEQYGEDVTVEFQGNAHSISIRQSSSSIQEEGVPSPLEPQNEDEEL